MTTVFGIKHPSVDSGVLVADRQNTSFDQNSGIPSEKYLGRKIWIGKNNDYCFGHSGMFDEETHEFLQKFSEEYFDIQKITKKGYFPELRKLNVKRMGKKLPDISKLSGIILGTRFEKNPKLYTCFPLGSVEERVWTTVGSGDEKINEYMKALQVLTEARDYIEGSNPDTRDIIRIGLEAVRRAQGRDLYSYGLDMLVFSSEGIYDHYADLGDDFKKKLNKIQKKYKG